MKLRMLGLMISAHACGNKPAQAPADVDRLSGVVEIVAGSATMCAVTGDREVYCWGEMSSRARKEVAARPRHIEGADGTRQLFGEGWAWTAELADGTLVGWPARDERKFPDEQKGDPAPLWPGIDETNISPWRALPTGEPVGAGRLLRPGWSLDGDALTCAYCAAGFVPAKAPTRATGVADVREFAMLVRHDDKDEPIDTALCVLHEVGRVECLRGDRRWDLSLPGPALDIADGEVAIAIVLKDGRIFTAASDLVPKPEPRVPLATAVDRDRAYVCAITRDRQVWCWVDSVLARADDIPTVPARVEGIDDATDLAVNGPNACALRSSGHVMCWGFNDRGQCGVGERSERVETPAYVVAPEGN